MRRLPAVLAVFACVLAAIPAVALAATTAPAASWDDLAPVGSIPDAPVDRSTQPSGADAEAAAVDPFSSGSTSERSAQDLVGSQLELRRRRAVLDAQRTDLLGRLGILEQVREQAETRLDDATGAIAQRLVDLFDQGEDARLQALMAVRDEADPQARARLVADMGPLERSLVAKLDAATDAATAAGADADQVRAQVLALGTRVAALDAALTSPDSAALARAGRTHFTVDADYVFATGPIPGIGYWGAASGGSMLTGWTGYASAALGGVGCTAPDPTMRATGSIEQGEASWYGPGFDGHGTATGETYDQEAMTAAHKTLPFGTIVRVYSSATGRCAFVRINDRGPYIDGRIIDLSHAAAVQIGMSGTAPVQVEVWSRPDGADVAEPAAPATPPGS